MTQPDLARLAGLVENMTEHLPWRVVDHEYEAKEWATIQHRTIMTVHDHPQMKGPLPVVALGSGAPTERGGMMVPIVWLTGETAEAIVGIMNAAPELLARIAALESENETLRDALEPFANKARKWEAQHPDAVYPDANSTTISHRFGDFRFARTAVTLKENDDGIR